MTWRDAIALAARSIGRRLGRAVLTVLAVALAAALLSSLLIASGAARSRVLDQVTSGGPLTAIRVAAAAPDPGALDSDNPPQGQNRAIDDQAVRRIERIPNVKSVVPIVANPILVVPPVTPPSGSQDSGRGAASSTVASRCTSTRSSAPTSRGPVTSP